MDPNQQTRSGSIGDPASHLQFQISLLRLMEHKVMEHKVTDSKITDQETAVQEVAGGKAGSSIQSPALQILELERLRHSAPAEVRVTTPI